MTYTAADLREVAADIRAKAAEAEQAGYGSDDPAKPWCSDWTYQAVRHVNRNMDMECPEHTWDDGRDNECNTWGRYAGHHIAAWAPVVALAVADWLTHLGDTLADDPSDYCGGEGHESWTPEGGTYLVACNSWFCQNVDKAFAFVAAWRGEQ